MAKSKFIEANKKIADNLTNGFQKMSDGVVKGYTTIEDAFVDRYLTKEDESVADAKIRLKAEREKRSAERKAEHSENIKLRKEQNKVKHSKEAHHEDQ